MDRIIDAFMAWAGRFLALSDLILTPNSIRTNIYYQRSGSSLSRRDVKTQKEVANENNNG